MSTLPVVSLQHFFDHCVDKNLPFAFYRLPDTNEIKVIAQKKSVLKKIPQGSGQSDIKGFLFSPFLENKYFSRVIIQPDIYTTSDHLPALDFGGSKAAHKATAKINKHEATKKEYKHLVLRIKGEIQRNNFTKVVASRIVKTKKPYGFEPVTFFKNLCRSYPDAFVSLIYTPEYGLWIGASPEVLLSVKDSNYKIYSLAGTRANTEAENKKDWGEKEKNEQQLISDYIANSLNTILDKKPVVTGPETLVAGNVQHLLTTFVYKDVPQANWLKITEQLHPTPAIGGIPKKEAIDFIIHHEIAPRGFYAGYLGPVNMDAQVNLFVNLRCTQVLKKKLVLHVGSGITAGSRPAAEWKETKLKANTLLGVLKGKKPLLLVSKNLSSLRPDEHKQKSGKADSGVLHKRRNP